MIPEVSSVQFSIAAVGVKVTAPHASLISEIVTVGGCFTFITLINVSSPQSVVIFCDNVYFPGFLNINLGFSEFVFEPFVKSQSDESPQFADS